MAKQALRVFTRRFQPVIIAVFWLIVLLAIIDLLLLKIVVAFVGPLLAVVWIVVSALLGALFARYEGLRVLGAYRDALMQCQIPDEGIVDGLLVLLGGVLLIMPGTIADVLGLVLLFPTTRKGIAQLVRARLASRFHSAVSQTISPADEPLRWIHISTYTSGDRCSSLNDSDFQHHSCTVQQFQRRDKFASDVIDTQGVVVQDGLLLPEAENVESEKAQPMGKQLS